MFVSLGCLFCVALFCLFCVFVRVDSLVGSFCLFVCLFCFDVFVCLFV